MARQAKVLFIGFDRLLPVTHGGRMAQYGYYLPLSRRFDVDVMMMSFGRSLKSLAGLPDCPVSRDLAFSYIGVVDDDLYARINDQSPYDAIVTLYPLDPARLRHRTKVVKIFLDLQSRHVQEDITLAPFTFFIEELERELFGRYDQVVACSPLDASLEAPLEYIPFCVEMGTREHYQSSRTLYLAGSAVWPRFTRSLDFLLRQIDLLQGHLLVYADLPQQDFHPKVTLTYDPAGCRTETCAYSIQPLDYISGIPAKSLESLSRGIPVITSPHMKKTCFAAHRHVYAVRDLREVNPLLDRDDRSLIATYAEISEDLDRERGCEVVADRLQSLLGL